jgi:glutamate-5-semialdehyde dehydrogenase
MLETIGKQAKEMSAYIRRLSSNQKNEVLNTCADFLGLSVKQILEANTKDMQACDPARAAFNDRLMLNEQRIAAMAEGLRKVARQTDPTGETLYMKTLPNGLKVGEKRVPLGVVGMIYEARPNVTTDSFGLCFKSGNACVLRGSSEAIHSNIALVAVLQAAIKKLNHPPQIVQLIEDTSRETAREFMRLNQYIDVLIPRGGAGLIKTTVENSTIPVIETGVGNCHIFVDESANLATATATAIILNAKTQRPTVCNSCEKVLIHASIAENFLPQICQALASEGVEIRGCEGTRAIFPAALPATEQDWHTEFLGLTIAIKIVPTPDAAISHIATYSSGHTEAILTENYSNAMEFIELVDSAAVFVNASTRFTDGEEFGLGAEVGISTQKLHARGPMGLTALTTTKFFAFGNGQVRG